MNWALLILAGTCYGLGTILLRVGSRRGGATTWGLALYVCLAPCAVAAVLGWPHLHLLATGYALWPLLMGALVIAAIWSTAEALRRGPTGPVFMIQSFSLVVPVAASVLFYGEPIGPARAVGLALIVPAIVLLRGRAPRAEAPNRPGPLRRRRGWLFYALLSFTLFGAVQVIMRDGVARRDASDAFLLGFILLTYLGNLAGAGLGLAASRTRPTRSDALWGTATGLVNFTGFVLSMFVLARMGGVLVFPGRFLVSCGVVVAGASVAFREWPDRRAAAGLALGAASVVLLAIKPG